MTNTNHADAAEQCLCGNMPSAHPSAGWTLAYCGDCGAATCPECRVEDSADRCSDCAARHYGRNGAADVFAEYRREVENFGAEVLCRLDDGESMAAAVENCGISGRLAADVIAYLRGE